MSEQNITILHIEESQDFAKLFESQLQSFGKVSFSVIWKSNYSDAIAEIESNENINIILLEYFISGKDGLQVAEELLNKRMNVPIVFLTVNKDFDIALKAMKLGAADYIVKEDISAVSLPEQIVSIVESYNGRMQSTNEELNAFRIQVIREAFGEVQDDLEKPLHEMRKVSDALTLKFAVPMHQTYIKIISDNIIRILVKLEKLKNLQEAKSVKYIKDITMIDLS